MLVLARKPGEKILVGLDVVIEVLEIKRDHVRLGITAPKEVPIDRKEVRDLKDKQ